VGTAAVLRHRPVWTGAVLAALWLHAAHGGRALAAGTAGTVAVAAVLLVVLRWLRPDAYSRYVALPLLGR
jgi:hypothetical protein